MDVSLMAKVKELSDKNRRLKKMYLGMKMRAMLVEEAFAKKVSRPSRRRELARAAVAQHSVSIELAYAAFCIGETCYRHQPKKDAGTTPSPTG
jgi:hypothetical protein